MIQQIEPKYEPGQQVRFTWPQTGQNHFGTITEVKGPFKTDNGPEHAYAVTTGAGKNFQGVAESRLELLPAANLRPLASTIPPDEFEKQAVEAQQTSRDKWDAYRAECLANPPQAL